MDKYDVAVVGLGYVGLTLSVALADLGFRVMGIEKRREIVDKTNAGEPHFSEVGLESLLRHVNSKKKMVARSSFSENFQADIYIITVGTPLKDGRFNNDFIKTATKEVANIMDNDALIILRSTVAIGTARKVVMPILSESGKRFQIAMCPERTLEGKAMLELRNLPQIIGADSEKTRERAAKFFYNMTPTIVQVSSLETAELIKLVDNTYRDVQFGFANEVARICEAYGINALEVINGGKLSYPRTNVPLPGLVGGPCLEKDPHILSQSLEEKNINLEITQAARLVNERQPMETFSFVKRRLEVNIKEKKPIIAVVGIAFKGIPATNDLRGSMALKLINIIKKQIPKSHLRVFDPVCSIQQLREEVVQADVYSETLLDAADGADCLIIANNHPSLGYTHPVEIYKLLAPKGFIYDYWNHFSDRSTHDTGNGYYGVGNNNIRILK